MQEDHVSFSVLSTQLKHIKSTDRLSVSLSKNSAKSFYLNQTKATAKSNQTEPKNSKDGCLTDAQNCEFFQFFNSKEKKLYTRFLDKMEANFEGKEGGIFLFITLTFNTTHDNYQVFTTNWNPNDLCWETITNCYPWLKLVKLVICGKNNGIITILIIWLS